MAAGDPSSDLSSDLHSAEYDPLAHLNQLFDDSSSLADLPELLNYTTTYNKSLTAKIKRDQEAYNKFVQSLDNGSSDGENSNLSFDTLSEIIAELVAEVHHTRERATGTETAITTMTSKIQKLDQCKKNLVLSMTVLKRLQMLLSAYDQLAYYLSDKFPRKNYVEILNLFSVVLELNNHFKSYKSIDEINALSKNIHNLKLRVTDSIFENFEKLINDDEDDGFGNGKGDEDDESNTEKKQENYMSACKILDVLGGAYKVKLVNWFCSYELKEIKSIFGNLNDEAGSIENIARRFIFFKRLLQSFNEYYKGYFPKEWEVDKELALKFCEFNQVNIQQHLNMIDRNADFNVNVILESLTETIDFENFLTDHFTKHQRAGFKNTDKKPEGLKPNEFNRKISSSFEPFLKIWLSDQEKTLDAKLLEFMASSNLESISKNQENELTNVFPSSADLFRIYRNILSQLVKLSNGSILIDLANVFNKYLERYLTQILKPLIPESHDVLTNEGETAIRYLGLIINTCDYMNSTVEQLDDTLMSLIKPEFKEQLKDYFENTKNLYLLLVSESLNKILLKIELDCELSWREMLNQNWKYISEVSDSSRYVVNLTRTLNFDLQLILSNINKNAYSRNLLDRLIDLIIEKFLINLVRLKPINDTMPSQILFDLSTLKKFFKKLPFLESDPQDPLNINSPFSSPLLGGSQSPSANASSTNIDSILNDKANAKGDGSKKINFTISKSYLNHMNNQFLKLEQLLKVLMVNGKDYSGLINTYLMIILDSNFDNFIKVLILKGVISQLRPIHSLEKKELMKYHEIFLKNVKEIGSGLKLTENNPFMSHLIIDVNQLPQTLVNDTSTSKLALAPSANSLKNFSHVLQGSPIMAGSLPSLSQNLNFTAFMNKNNNSPNFNKENFEKNLKEFAMNSETSVKNLNENFKSNLGKFFNRNNE